MTDKEQIEELNELVDLLEDIGHDWDSYLDRCIEEEEQPELSYEDFHADSILAAGYRKASEVAREIFEEIEERIAIHTYTSKSENYSEGALDTLEWVDEKIDELKKKYTEGKG